MGNHPPTIGHVNPGAGLKAKLYALLPEGVRPAANAGEPRAFDEDDLYAREFDEDDLYTREFDEELFARALADELVTRKVTFGEVMGDIAKILKREDEESLSSRDDEDEVVARDTYFDELD